MDRTLFLKSLESEQIWDFIIIGGGATGLGTALDAVSRGFKTLLLEQSDFAKATSSRSTKLIHGGLRYLRQGHFVLVKEALEERGILKKNAPHLIHERGFIIPFYSFSEGFYFRLGVRAYDMLAGKYGFQKSQFLSRKEVLQLQPTLQEKGLKGGILFFDGQFDDARYAICLAKTAASLGAVVLNYFPVFEFIKKEGQICGVKARDSETNKEYSLIGRSIINATGVFCDTIRSLENPYEKKIVEPSRGSHIVVSSNFLPSKEALLIPKTKDGRILFLIPWHNHLLIGTTDQKTPSLSLEPSPQKSEIDFLIEHANSYLNIPLTQNDILSVFSGLRPLLKMDEKRTADIPREYAILISPGGLVTITGGKWTTYRKMAEKVVDRAIHLKNLPFFPSKTHEIPLENSQGEEISFFVQKEMARTVEDVLARRTRKLFLNAKEAIDQTEKIAALMAKEMNQPENWIHSQCQDFKQLASHYLPNSIC